MFLLSVEDVSSFLVEYISTYLHFPNSVCKSIIIDFITLSSLGSSVLVYLWSFKVFLR